MHLIDILLTVHDAVFFSSAPFRGQPGCSDMVIYFDWHGAAMDQKSRSSLPMTGEDTGLVALASPLVGYLGKVSRPLVRSHCCHLRKAELNLKNTVTGQYQSKFNKRNKKKRQTEIFVGKRRKFLKRL